MNTDGAYLNGSGRTRHPPDGPSWHEAVLAERRMTKIEMTAEDLQHRVTALEADAVMMRRATWHLARGTIVLLSGLALDQGLNAGAFLAMLRATLSQ